MDPLRLLIFDDTCRGSIIGLSHAWRLGSDLYGAVGRIDGSYAARSWDGALAWLASFQPERRIQQVQFWGHGKWGKALIDRQPFDDKALLSSSRHKKALDALEARLDPGALIWFRTCETFGGAAGHRFARALGDRLGVRSAGHTFIIATWQSGLHSLAPGGQPDWPADEGLIEGTAEAPRRAHWSRPWAVHTIHCLRSSVPAAW